MFWSEREKNIWKGIRVTVTLAHEERRFRDFGGQLRRKQCGHQDLPQGRGGSQEREGNAIFLVSKLQLHQAGAEGARSQKGPPSRGPSCPVEGWHRDGIQTWDSACHLLLGWLKTHPLNSLSFSCLICPWREGGLLTL